jgi:hypothetical protein
MGDRAVAGFRAKSATPTIFLYQHWSGEEQNRWFAEALEAARPRWSDDSYATRIMVSRLVNDQWTSETGFGLYVGGTSHGADYNYILVADFEKQMVLICENDNSDNVLAEIGFEDYLANYEVLVPNSTIEINQKKHEEFIAKYPELAGAFS